MKIPGPVLQRVWSANSREGSGLYILNKTPGDCGETPNLCLR